MAGLREQAPAKPEVDNQMKEYIISDYINVVRNREQFRQELRNTEAAFHRFEGAAKLLEEQAQRLGIDLQKEAKAEMERRNARQAATVSPTASPERVGTIVSEKGVEATVEVQKQ